MRNRQNITFFVIGMAVLLLNACSNTKFLTGDQMLYTGRKKINMVSPDKSKLIQPAEEIAAEVSYAEPNNSLMGKRVLPPVGLWYYNYQKPDEGKNGGFFYRISKQVLLLIYGRKSHHFFLHRVFDNCNTINQQGVKLFFP